MRDTKALKAWNLHEPLTITNDKGNMFNVRFKEGDELGNTVAFIDMHNSLDMNEWQFTGGSYYIDTILYDGMTREPTEWDRGLNLHGGVPKWQIDGGAMKQVRSYIKKLGY